MKLSDELREMSDSELEDYYEDLKEDLYKLRLNHSTGELVDTSQFKAVRRTIARTLTILNERRLAAQLAQEDEG